jgi:pSer/pThr/pTyr-binding forkhead associated (FHA) protein
MFALKVSFRDGSTASEMVLVRRPYFIVGADSKAHVVVEDMQALGFDLAVAREAGGSFRCKTLNLRADTHYLARELTTDQTFRDEVELNFDVLRVQIIALDSDLLVKEGEPPDQAGIRILQRSAALPSPSFPALVVANRLGSFVFSFAPDHSISVGRAKNNLLRLDFPEVSSQHARIGFEDGSFWIEDLGSTNGTFLNEQQVAGRVEVPIGVPVVLARNSTIVGVMSLEQAKGKYEVALDTSEHTKPTLYPVIISTSEVARPARLVLSAGVTYRIGRDPSSDMWLGAPHISRQHCEISLGSTGVVTITDVSTNGTVYQDGVLRNGDTVTTSADPRVLSFGGGISVAVCFDEGQERIFVESQGSLYAFSPSKAVPGAVQGMVYPQARPSGLIGVESLGSRGGQRSQAYSGRPYRGLFASLRSAGTPLIVLAMLSFIFVLFLIISLLKGVFV